MRISAADIRYLMEEYEQVVAGGQTVTLYRGRTQPITVEGHYPVDLQAEVAVIYPDGSVEFPHGEAQEL